MIVEVAVARRSAWCVGVAHGIWRTSGVICRRWLSIHARVGAAAVSARARMHAQVCLNLGAERRRTAPRAAVTPGRARSRCVVWVEARSARPSGSDWLSSFATAKAPVGSAATAGASADD